MEVGKHFKTKAPELITSLRESVKGKLLLEVFMATLYNISNKKFYLSLN